MKHPIHGVAFISQTQSLPSYTFVSFDALVWLKTNLDNSRNPLDILESMRKEKMICHASGDFNKPVIPGFYLYYIAQQDKNAKGIKISILSFHFNEIIWNIIYLQTTPNLSTI